MHDIDDGVTWQLLLDAAPQRVFCVLVRVTTERHSLCAIQDYGMGLTFRASRDRSDSRLMVHLEEHQGRTLVQIWPCGPYVRRDTVTEAEAIGALFHDLRSYLDPSRMRPLAIAANLPAAAGSTSR